MRSITLLPLDDRPCCLVFPQRIAAMAGAQVNVPPREWLGRFHEAGQVDRLLAWLEEQPEPWLVSLDMAVFGGLVASRRPDLTLEQALERFEHFERIAEGREVLAFQSILRAAPTQSTPEEVTLAEKLVELGVVSVKAQSGDARAARRVAELEALLSPGVVAAYHGLRERNYSLNQLAVRWSVRTGQAVLLGIDDSKTSGWNVLEARELQARIVAEGANAWVAPGTDESALLLLARWLGPQPVRPLWWGSPDVVGRYEDRSLQEVLAAQARAAGVELREDAGRTLFLWAPEEVQREAAEAQAYELPAEALPSLAEALDAGPVALADLRYANGGDLTLMQAVLEKGLGARLTAYTGWNTAGNTLGTALAALAVADPASPERPRFLLERLADDLLYQGHVRARLRAALGHAGLALTPAEQALMQAALAREMETALQRVGLPETGWRLALPWSRLFEVEMEATGSPTA